jgi:hypothetical protein
MTALSIAEAEPRATADPQVSGVPQRGIRVKSDLASVTDLAGAARRNCEADPEISRRAGVSRTTGVSRRAAGSIPVGVSRARQPVPAGVSRRLGAPGRTEVQHQAAGLTAGTEARRAGPGRDDRRRDDRLTGTAAGEYASVAGPATEARARVAPGPVRLTSRGRAVMAGLVAAVAVCAGLLLAAGGAAAVSHGSPGAGYQGMRQVVVKPGQTLWSIASTAEPTADPQAVIQQILTANSLPGSTIHAGQVLWVPRG